MTPEDSLTYKAAGVDIDAGDALVERIVPAIQRTRRPEVLGSIGGFGGLFRMPQGYRDPVLVAGTDGVGTKLKLAAKHDAHDQIGIDLVAMSVNDVLVVGAEPLFFLDYYVSQRLDVDIAARVITGIARGCELAGCALIGGETAEHPGMHTPGEYDLAGFCVGVVERERLLDGSSIVAGDAVIGIASSGVHSNGFSLVRRVLARHPEDSNALVEGRPLHEHLLTPTRIYARAVLPILAEGVIKGMAHITGGGLIENIPRVLPTGLGVRLDRASWQAPPVFDWLERRGIARAEMWRTFNCGIGMVLVVPPQASSRVLALLSEAAEDAWVIGEIEADAEQKVRIE